MEMFLLVACMSLFGLGVTALAFGAATRSAEPVEETAAEPVLRPAAAPARFFADVPAPPAPARPRVPIEALLLSIENHVRGEQAAAQSFLESPTAALLRSRPASPFVN
jgi:hypothetical protein